MRTAVIPSAGRPCLEQAVDAIYDQVDVVIVIDNDHAHEYLVKYIGDPKVWRFLCDTKLNVSHWWNEGLNLAQYRNRREETWDVAVLNDDAIVPPGWFEHVAGPMRRYGAVAGCSGDHDVIQRTAQAVPLDMRMQGYAFVLAGEAALVADEKFHWYCGDDDLDWRAREAGGMVMVRGEPVQHLFPNGQVTPEIHELIAKDMESFVNKWGRRPW